MLPLQICEQVIPQQLFLLDNISIDRTILAVGVECNPNIWIHNSIFYDVDILTDITGTEDYVFEVRLWQQGFLF